VPLSRERFWDIPVPKSTRQRDKLGPRSPCVRRRYALPRWEALRDDSQWLDGVSDALACRLRGFGTFRSLRHFANTPAPYAYRGLPASCFALPRRAAAVGHGYNNRTVCSFAGFCINLSGALRYARRFRRPPAHASVYPILGTCPPPS